MPYQTLTPCDRDDMHTEPAKAPIPWGRVFANWCYLLIKSTAFTLTTFLMVLGLPLFFFLLLSGWNMELLFLQLDNLASRFVEADEARQLVFSDQLRGWFYLATALVALWRLPGFVAQLSFRVSRKDEA